MVDNTMVTRDGVKLLVNRAFKNVPDYTILSRFRVSIDTPDVTYTDTSLITQIPISGTELIDACNATTGWSASGTNSITVNNTTYKPDGATDGALNIIKSDITSSTISITKATTSLNGTSKDFLAWIYIKDTSTLAKISSFTIRYGSDNTNYYYKTYTLSVGWNFVKLAIPAAFSTTGSPIITALDYTYIAIVTNNNTDVFVAGDIIIDALRLASADCYYKNFDSLAIDEVDGSITITSKLSISEANGFLLNGISSENIDVSPIMGIKSKHPANSKGNSDLIKYVTKLKIRNVNQ